MGSETNMRPLFEKLGHNLEEIRVRALKNILSKLQHNLVCDADLVQEKTLHIRLLEWFNFPSCPMQEKVLGLLLRLSKHPSAAGIILDIGGVEFLTQLRPNVEGDLHKMVDSILEQLFHLPLSQHESHTNECIYKQHAHHTHKISTQYRDQSHDGIPSHYLQPSDTFTDMTSDSETYISHGATSQRIQAFASPPDEQQIGYFERSREEARHPVYVPQTIPAAAAYCFKFSTFPWIALTPTDRHVLSSTDSSLKGKDISLVMSACEFLSDVVYEDFPAEVFLQRPSIMKSLLSLLSVPHEDPKSVALYAVKTLQDLAIAIETRIYFYQDPATYTPKQDFTHAASRSSSSSSFLSHSLGSSDSRPSVIGHSDMRHRGDGQDGDNSGESSGTHHLDGGGIEQTDIDDIHSLQFMQWTTPQFCMAVLEKLLPCLKSPDEEFILHSLGLLHQLAALLRESVSADVLWEDTSAPAKELIDQFRSSLEMLGDVLYLHHHANLSQAAPEALLSQHRVAFMGVAVFIMHYVETLLPRNKASSILTEDFANVLALIAQDEGLSLSFPDVRSTTLEYLQMVKFDAYEALLHAQQIGLSLQNTCTFLMESDEPNDDNMVELIEDAESGLHSLPYHLSAQYITTCVHLASLISRKVTPNPIAVKKSKQILLQLLAHPITFVRQQAYAATNAIVKESLGISHVTEPTSSATQGVVFLIDQQILYEICCFGLNDKEPKVKKCAEEILLYILQSQLLLSAARWQQVIDTVAVVLPVLQGYATTETGLGKRILGLLATDTAIQTGCLPILERFRGTLRLMYSPDNRLRSEGLGKLTWFLAHEPESLRKVPLFSELDVTTLSSLLLIEAPRSLLDEDTSRSVFQTEGLQKVYNIFTSERVEADVRRSAAEQLAIMIQDPALQPIFLEKGGLDYVIQILVTAVKKHEDDDLIVDRRLLAPILKMLRAVVQHNYGLRHKLAHSDTIFYAALRCALLLNKDFIVRQEVSELLAFLLFDEVAMATSPDDDTLSELNFGFSLPASLVKKYRLPFKPPTHHASSPHTVDIPPESDPLSTGVLAELLRFTWNIAWHNGVEEAIKQATGVLDNTDNLFSPKLKLNQVDRVILQTSHVKSGLLQSVHAIENAVSHAMVFQAVLRMSSYLALAAHHDISETLHALNWREAIHRFMQIIPSSSADENLLRQILHFLILVLSTRMRAPPDVLTWMSNVLHDHQGALLGLLSRTESPGEDATEAIVVARRQLNRVLLKFVKKYVASNKYCLADKKTFECVRGDLTKHLLSRINRTDAAHFYNLASLESTLLCLMHVTARPGWSTLCADMDSLSLCLKLLQSLLEVVSAFHVGRGGISMSYMGRGVTRCAAVCLRHLAHEMATQLQSKDWPRNWLFSRQATADSVGESGFHWLIPLWSYRDTEVRAAGLGVAAALTGMESGRITMATQCQHIPGGIWGTAFSILLDQTECSLVRQQAAHLLTNMTSQAMPVGNVDSLADVWQGPIVRNEQTQESLVGMPALLALLHHSSFYQEMLMLLSNYYPQPAIQPISLAATESKPASQANVSHQASLSTSSSATPRSAGGTPSSAVRTSTPASQDRPATLGQPGHDASFIQSAPAGPTPVSGAHGAQLSNQSGTNRAMSASNTPASVIGQRHNASTPTSVTDTTVSEYHSVASPCLVSAVTKLLSNLIALATEDSLENIIKLNIHKVLLSMLDVNILDAYIGELVHTPYRKRYVLAFRNVIRLYTDVLELLTTCALQNETVRMHIHQDKTALKQIVKLLGISFQDDLDTSMQCEALWQAVFSLFTTLFTVSGTATYQHSVIIIVKHWQTIAARIITILQDPKQADSSLWIAALNFLAASLSEEGKARAKGAVEGEGIYYIVHRLDSPAREESEDIFTSCNGSILSQSLIKAFDTVLLKPMEQCYKVKMSVFHALKSLLVLSSTAKMAALEGGLIETLTEHMKHLTQKLTMDSMDVLKVIAKKKENVNMTEMIMLLDLLRNFMFCDSKVKIAAYESGLSGLMHKCWAFCELDQSLMSCMLALLCTYTARCPQASSSLAFTHALSIEDKPTDKQQHSSNSLVHCLIKLVPRDLSNGNISNLKTTFALLATLALSQECRGILWKSNFLHEFSTLTPKKPKKTKVARLVEGLWLDLLVNLSFCTEGQNMILKIKDSLNLLLEFGASSVEVNQSRAVLVLRNLCFHASNKPVVLANQKVLPFFLSCLETGSEEVKAVVCSAMLALLFNNQKAKVVFKNQQVLKKLQDTHNVLASSAQSALSHRCIEHIEDILIQLTA